MSTVDTPVTGDVTWITVTEACTRSGVAKRTVRRWIAEERVVSRLEGEPGRQQRVIRADTLPPVTATGDVLGDDTVTVTRATLNQRDSRAPGDDTRAATGDGTGARGDSGLERLVTAQAEEIQQLRAQIEARTMAEAELRRLLLSSQQALQLALERPMLPPAPDTQPETPKRTRWWQLWR